MKTRLFSILFRLLASTWRYRVSGSEPAGACVLAFWHASMTAVWKHFAFTDAVGVTSLSKDGDLLAGLLADWHYRVVRGSSSKGGAQTLESMVSLARNHRVLVTPDGPRGPARVTKPGAVVAAHRADVPLVFCSVGISRAYTFPKSWDRFMLPLPFSRITLHFHPPVVLPRDASREHIESVIRSLDSMP
ncbi:MAG: lysophospholipid acyltransferase family protein [Candidatus Kapaibacterium sp.]